jgi:hypothetical protein
VQSAVVEFTPNFLRNLAPDLTHYPGEYTTEIETYERSRHRNDNRNVSASASLAWARRSVGSGGVARTQRNATERKQDKTYEGNGVEVLPLDVCRDQPHP